MSESKAIKELGLVRKVHVYDTELLDFVTCLVARQGPGGSQRSTKDFDERKRTRAMLKQLQAYDMYIKLTDKTGAGLKVDDIKKDAHVVEITVESIDFFLSQVKDVPIGESMRVCDLEERLTDAKSGAYILPAEYETKTEAQN